MNKRSQSPLSDEQLRALSDLLADESGPSGGGIKSQVAEFIDLIRSAMWPEIFTFGNDEQILLCARLDNLGKGASGAAVQCLNIMMGIDETTGLL